MSEPGRGPKRVLVVDDDRALAETLAEGLVERGYDAIPMVDGRDAAKALEHDHVDALVTDLRMPHIDGQGLLAISRAAAPARPVIMMTAFGAVDEVGADGHLTKPFKVEELAHLLEGALAKASHTPTRALPAERALGLALGAPAPRIAEAPRPPALGAFLAYALTLGVVGFGGGFVVAQRARRVLVEERRWLDADAYIEALSVASSLPGTTATNLLTVLGYRFAGLRGALGGALAFLAPSIALMVAFGAAYDHLRDLSVLAAALDGMGVATVGVVAAAAVDMARHTIKRAASALIAAAALALLVSGAFNLLEVVVVSGLVGAIWLRPRGARASLPPADDYPPGSLRGVMLAALPSLSTVVASGPLLALLLVFARIGVATFGGGIAMIAPIEHEVVHVRGWLGEAAFEDAIVLGQITPGPIAISATFIGYRVAGLLGAAAATLGMFGPPFALAIAAARSMNAFRTSPVVQGFLAAVAPAVAAAIAAAAVALFHGSVRGAFDGVLAGAIFVLLVVRPHLSPLVPIAAAGAFEALVARL